MLGHQRDIHRLMAVCHFIDLCASTFCWVHPAIPNENLLDTLTAVISIPLPFNSHKAFLDMYGTIMKNDFYIL
jgi:hypothetical protein